MKQVTFPLLCPMVPKPELSRVEETTRLLRWRLRWIELFLVTECRIGGDPCYSKHCSWTSSGGTTQNLLKMQALRPTPTTTAMTELQSAL